MVTQEKHGAKASQEGYEYAYLRLSARATQDKDWGAWRKET